LPTLAKGHFGSQEISFEKVLDTTHGPLVEHQALASKFQYHYTEIKLETLIAWLLTFMVAVAPPTRKHWYSYAKETPEEALVRYQSIAEDIVSVLYNPDNLPLFVGSEGRARSAAVVLGVMFFEGGFRRDVDLGLGPMSRGDGGQSYCLMQIRVGKGRTTTWNKALNRFGRWNDSETDLVQGFTGPEMVQDRKKCIEAGYRMIRSSFAACRSLPVADWLRVYASGTCEDGDGAHASRARMNVALNWFNGHRPTFTDSQILSKTTPKIASN
jgi:hypothetical protein